MLTVSYVIFLGPTPFVSKRTLTYFWPTQVANSFIALYIIYQAFYIYLYPLRSEYNQLVVGRIFIMIKIGNASQIWHFSTNF